MPARLFEKQVKRFEMQLQHVKRKVMMHGIFQND